MNNPQHLGLGQPTAAPQPQGNQSPYYQPNAALAQATGRITGENEMKLAQAEQAGAMAGKARAEADIMQGLQAAGRAQAIQATAEGYTNALMQGANPQALMAEAEQRGEVESLGMAMQEMRRQEAMAAQQYNAQEEANLGTIPGY